MRFFLSFLFLFSGMISSYPQSLETVVDSSKKSSKQNTVYLEFLGNGFIYSVNYDRILFEKGNFKISGRVGYTYLPYWEAITAVQGPGLPLELNFLLGKRSSFLELGFGATYFYFYDFDDQEHFHFLMENLRLGWRYQKPTGGLSLRIAMVPISTFPIDRRFDDEGWIIPYFFGISLGYTLSR